MNLYRHFDSKGQLLYVGVALDVIRRLSAHKASVWFDDIATITIQKFKTKEAALEAESAAIKSEKPIHNMRCRGRRWSWNKGDAK